MQGATLKLKMVAKSGEFYLHKYMGFRLYWYFFPWKECWRMSWLLCAHFISFLVLITWCVWLVFWFWNLRSIVLFTLKATQWSCEVKTLKINKNYINTRDSRSWVNFSLHEYVGLSCSFVITSCLLQHGYVKHWLAYQKP